MAIFVLSHQPADLSSQVSGGLIYRVLNFIVSNFDHLANSEKTQMVESLQYVVRKGAHACSYAAMGALSMGLVSTFDFKKRGLPVILAFLITLLYSISDEVHQLFVQGRSGQVSDVVLDSCGAVFGIAIAALFIYVARKRRQRQNKREKL